MSPKSRSTPQPSGRNPSAIITALSLLLAAAVTVAAPAFAESAPPKTVMLFYLNGDNDLGPEVLHCLDLLETVGSSPHLKILALVDGHGDYLGPYGEQWRGTRLLEIRPDREIGVIRSPVLADYGELNLGTAATLEAFVRYGTGIVADRYYFAIFAHGRGVIDTRAAGPTAPDDHKRLALSSDATSGSQLSLGAFRDALKRGLGGKRFEAMVFLTCLANMVEIAYELKEVTDYLVASPDEIRIVNQPPGRFQIRGIPFEEMLTALNQRPAADPVRLGKRLVDAYIAQYLSPVSIETQAGESRTRHFSASLALVDCRTLNDLSRRLDHLAALLTQRLRQSAAADDWRTTLQQVRRNTRRYPSFLDLEYYDLVELLEQLSRQLNGLDTDLTVREACHQALDLLRERTIVYARHTSEAPSGGLGIYFSHGAVPRNIYATHQEQYLRTRWSADTRWDELVEILRDYPDR